MSKFAPLNLTAEEIIEFTPLWQGARTPDGRPFVADSVITRLKNISLTQAWGVLITNDYRHQFEGGWQRIFPDENLCGRAVTAVFMPRRPDLKDTIGKKAEAAGQVGDITSWPIYALGRRKLRLVPSRCPPNLCQPDGGHDGHQLPRAHRRGYDHARRRDPGSA
jgi:hypothetical protein